MKRIEQLLINGLLQFGLFHRNGTVQPVLSKLDMLASYPQTLHALIEDAGSLVGGLAFDRMLCTADALPFGIALSLDLNSSLVYSRGRGEAPADDLVGAYDIGHPTLLVANTSGDELIRLAQSAAKVGLDVKAVLVILEITPIQIPNAEIKSILSLETLIESEIAANHIPEGQREAVKAWLKQQNAPTT